MFPTDEKDIPEDSEKVKFAIQVDNEIQECGKRERHKMICARDLVFMPKVSNIAARIAGSFDCKDFHKLFCSLIQKRKLEFFKVIAYVDKDDCCKEATSFLNCPKTCQDTIKKQYKPLRQLGVEVLGDKKYVVCDLITGAEASCTT